MQEWVMSKDMKLQKEVDKRVEETMNYLGMCGMVGLTEQAKKNVRSWLTITYTLFYRTGDRDGFREGGDSILEAWNKSLGK